MAPGALLLFAIAALELVVGAVVLAFGSDDVGGFGLCAAALITVGCVLQVRANHIERKIHGRYRKALEAHRAGAHRGAGYRPGYLAGGGSLGARAGAGMSGGQSLPDPFLDRLMRQALQQSRLTLASSTYTPPKPKSGEFHGAEFAAGVVRGSRSFDLDKLGRLRGVSYPGIWRPGENVAQCLRRTSSSFIWYGDEVEQELPKDHSLADCEHGFYGYYDGSNDFYEEGRVMAVVEGYGETVIGTRGFRASKARIVALHIPADLRVGARNLIARNYPDVPLFESFDAMVAEFPPDDAGQGLNPTNDPDFWTREA